MDKVKKQKFIILIGVLVLVGTAFIAIKNPATASASDNLSGWAWSENIGWISFNCTNTNSCASSNYGVTVAQNGALSGYAWSENIGWISFNSSDVSGCPSTPCPPKLKKSQGKLEGWAKALAANGSGWEGWIHLANDNYGVTISGCSYSGYAWGSDVIGWVHFKGTNYGVRSTESEGCSGNPPTASAGSPFGGGISVPPGSGANSGAPSFGENPAGACTAPLRPTLPWTYSDPDGNAQDSYQIQIDNDSDFSSPEYDTGTNIHSGATSFMVPSGALAYNITYFWRVKVWDVTSAASAWSNGPSFSTQIHQAPTTGFTWSPINPNANQNVNFQDTGQVYGGSSKQSWAWTFQNGNPSSSSAQNPISSFSTEGVKNITLILKDSDNLSCGNQKPLTVGTAPAGPRWREIAP